MEYVISNDFIEVKIDEKGAELKSIKSKISSVEYLWQGDPTVWNRQAPILFPIVGRLRDNKYTYKGKTYELPQHGFARDRMFEVAASGDQEILLFLTEDDISLANYPFKFILFITYLIDDLGLKVSYDVKNTDENEIYFSIGGHPGFNCPWESNCTFEDYQIKLELDESPQTWLLEGPYQNGKTKLLDFNNGKLKLSKALFENDALIFKDLKSKTVSLVNDKSGQFVKMQFDNFNYFGIWSKKDSDQFICLEPWAGIADAINASGQFENKEGIIKLVPNESYQCSYRISFG